MCGDSVCDANEDSNSCPADCGQPVDQPPSDQPVVDGPLWINRQQINHPLPTNHRINHRLMALAVRLNALQFRQQPRLLVHQLGDQTRIAFRIRFGCGFAFLRR